MDKSMLPVVTSSKLFIDNNYECIDEEGLLSQRIFGPLTSWHCLCGKLRTKTLYSGQTCKHCGVKCDSNDLRYTTFAKIVIPFPVYKNTLRGRTKLRKIIKSSKYLIDPIQADMSLTASNYLSFDPGKDILKIQNTYDPNICIPIKITGIYTLYIALLAGYEIYNSPTCENIIKTIFTYEIVVVPPGPRNVVIKENNGIRQLIQHDLNKYYTSILRLSNFDWGQITDPRQIELAHLDKIRFSLGSATPVATDDLVYADNMICRYQYFTNLIYKDVLKSMSGKNGYIRRDYLGRTVDFAARAHIVVDPSLCGFEIKVPRRIFITLWFIEYLHFLYAEKGIPMDTLTPHVKSSEIRKNFNNLIHIEEFINHFFDSSKVDSRKLLVFINRQPTLWRYGIPCVRAIGISDGDVIGLSQLTLDCMNADL